MNLIITRNFPPDVGGMQNLMFGLTKSLSEHMMVKVFADEHSQQDKFDEDLSFSIERVGGPKIFRKFRKAYLIDETQEIAKKYDAVCTPDFFGYNKDLKLNYRGRIRELNDLKPVGSGDSELLKSMKLIAKTQQGPKEQYPSMGCSIKWFK